MKSLNGLDDGVFGANEELRELMDKVESQTKLGKYVKLPMIAVMGDTSSGKSSLLSALSGVELPSSSKLCTRCPIKLQMRRTNDDTGRKAVVSIQWKTVGDDATAFNEVITEDDWEKLTETIAKAQARIITVTGKYVADDQVLVEITGPTCEDLTLMDLPGIVRMVGKDENASIIKDIQVLIEGHLQNERCVILAVHPAPVDFHNSGIINDAMEVDPDKKRTIPVITKPDLADSGGEEDVVELLLGNKTETFAMGFHMVKGRGQNMVNEKVTLKEALKDEEEFFETRSPWCEVSERGLFGTKNLAIKLGELQLNRIRDSIPKILGEIEDRLEKVRNRLDQMGTICGKMHEKRMFFLEIIAEYSRNVEKALKGIESQNEALFSTELTATAKFRDKAQAFKEDINRGKLAGTSTETPSWTKVWVRGKDIKVGEFVEFHPDGKVKVRVDSAMKRADGTLLKADMIFPSESVRHYDPDWIYSLLKTKTMDYLPFFFSPDIFNMIVAKSIDEDCHEPCLRLVEDSKLLLKTCLKDCLKDVENVSRYDRLEKFLLLQVNKVADDIFKEVQEDVEKVVRRHKRPYTQQQSVIDTKKKLEVDHWSRMADVAGSAGEKIADAMQNVFNLKTKDPCVAMTAEMEYALESYGGEKMRIFIDEIPHICMDAIRSFPKEMQKALRAVAAQDKGLERVLADKENFVREHKNLQAEEKELNQALEIFQQVF